MYSIQIEGYILDGIDYCFTCAHSMHVTTAPNVIPVWSDNPKLRYCDSCGAPIGFLAHVINAPVNEPYYNGQVIQGERIA